MVIISCIVTNSRLLYEQFAFKLNQLQTWVDWIRDNVDLTVRLNIQTFQWFIWREKNRLWTKTIETPPIWCNKNYIYLCCQTQLHITISLIFNLHVVAAYKFFVLIVFFSLLSFLSIFDYIVEMESVNHAICKPASEIHFSNKLSAKCQPLWAMSNICSNLISR